MVKDKNDAPGRLFRNYLGTLPVVSPGGLMVVCGVWLANAPKPLFWRQQ